MLKPKAVVLAALCSVFAIHYACAAWQYTNKKFGGDYLIYGGYPDRKKVRAPSPGDTKVAFSVRGTAAKEIFDAIGPEPAERAPAQQACPGRPDVLVRERDALICRHHPTDGYWCTFGFDLSTGLGAPGLPSGAICNDSTN